MMQRFQQDQRRIRPKLALALGIVTVVSLLGWASSAEAAPSSLFELNVGVRALGMGEAFVATADDEQAVLYNPAGLAFVERASVNTLFERRFGASSYASVMGALPQVGAGLAYFDLGGIEQRTNQDEVEGTFGYRQVGLTGAGAVRMDQLGLGLRNVALGTQLRIATESTVGGPGFGLALGWGGLFQARDVGFLSEIDAGLLVENLPGIGVSGPIRPRLGLAIHPISDLNVAFDLGLPFEFHLGSEFDVPLPTSLVDLALRTGLFTRGSDLAFTMGFGVNVSSLRFDYAFMTHSVLAGTHRLAVVWQF